MVRRLFRHSPPFAYKRVLVGLLLIFALILLRGRAFFTPFSDPTPGLYLHIAQAWREGHIPYSTTWDYRPPGYFALYALAVSIVGAAFAKDILAVLSLAITTYFVSVIARQISKERNTGVEYWAAAFFVMMSPANDGIAGVAELQISALIAGAIALALTHSTSLRRSMAVGVLAGLAIQCKLSAIPLAVVPLVVIALRSSNYLKPIVGFAAGFFLPVAADVIYFVQAKALDSLWNANIGATVRRAQSATNGDEFSRNRVNFIRQFIVLAPQIELSFFALSNKVNASRVASIGWLFAAILSIVAAGEFYERQFVLLTAPVAILGAIGLVSVTSHLHSALLRKWIQVVLIIATFAADDYYSVNQTIAYTIHRLILHDSTWRRDQTAELFATMKCLPKEPNELFLIEQNPYLYDLLGDQSPTKFAYSDHLLDPRLSFMAEIDARAELSRVLGSSPTYVVVSSLKDFRYSPAQVRLILATLRKSYEAVYRTSRFTVYRYTRTRQAVATLPCDT